MTRQARPTAVPECIVLATDLSARCDRALDRSAQLAMQWHAKLVALNVLDPVALPDQALAWAGGASDDELMQMACQELARDLAGLKVQAQPRIVRSNDPADAIAQAAVATRAGLVVTGVARSAQVKGWSKPRKSKARRVTSGKMGLRNSVRYLKPSMQADSTSCKALLAACWALSLASSQGLAVSKYWLISSAAAMMSPRCCLRVMPLAMRPISWKFFPCMPPSRW